MYLCDYDFLLGVNIKSVSVTLKSTFLLLNCFSNSSLSFPILSWTLQGGCRIRISRVPRWTFLCSKTRSSSFNSHLYSWTHQPCIKRWLKRWLSFSPASLSKQMSCPIKSFSFCSHNHNHKSAASYTLVTFHCHVLIANPSSVSGSL